MKAPRATQEEPSTSTQEEPSTSAPVDARRPRTRLSADQRRAQILDSAREVFLRSGASGTRVKDLADAAGVNPALLYQHFESKEEMFEEAVLRPLTSAFEETALRFPEVKGQQPRGELVREATETYIVHLLEAMDKVGALLGVVLFDDLDGGKAFFQERLEPMLAGLREVVTAYLPAWEHVDYDPEVAVMLVFGTAWYFAIENRFSERPPRDARETAAQISAIIFDGLRSR